MTYKGCAYLYTGSNIAMRADSEVALAQFGANI
jgi:hypothetical protein